MKKIVKCALCNQSPLATGVVLYTVAIRQFLMDMNAIRRQVGLGLQLTPELAEVMGPDEDLAKFTYGVKAVICQACALSARMVPLQLMERLMDRKEPEKT